MTVEKTKDKLRKNLRPATNEEVDAAICKMVDKRLPKVLKKKGVKQWGVCGIDLDTPQGKLMALRVAESLPDFQKKRIRKNKKTGGLVKSVVRARGETYHRRHQP